MANETTKNAAEKTKTASKTASNSKVLDLYTKRELVQNSHVFGCSSDIVDAALTEKGIENTSVEEAKKIVKEFRERKVN